MKKKIPKDGGQGNVHVDMVGGQRNVHACPNEVGRGSKMVKILSTWLLDDPLLGWGAAKIGQNLVHVVIEWPLRYPTVIIG